MGSSFGLSFLAVIFFPLLFLFLPFLFLQFGAFVPVFLSLVSMIVGIVYKAYGSIAFFIFAIIFSVCYFFAMRPGVAFSATVMNFVRSILGKLPVFLSIVTGITAVTVISLFSAYLAYYAWSIGWGTTVYVYIIITFWYLVSVVSQCVYQICAQVVGHQYFSGAASPGLPAILHFLKRGLVDNLGIASFNAFFLQLFRPFYAWARISPSEVQTRVTFLPSLAGRVLSAFFTPFHLISVPLCQGLDNMGSYPSQRGSVYSAFFGVSREEGCRRIAEIDSRFYACVLNENCYVDFLFGFVALGFEIWCGIIAWGIATDTVQDGFFEEFAIYYQRLAAGFAFFITFGFLQVVRMAIAGIVDAAFVCFFELPEGMGRFSGEADAGIKAAYEGGVARKAGVTERRMSARLLNQETFVE
jgi:hypothetical protein